MSTHPSFDQGAHQPAQQGAQGQWSAPGQQTYGQPTPGWPQQGQPGHPQPHYPQPSPASSAQPARRSGKAPTVIVTALLTAVVSVTATLLATGAFTAAPTFEDAALAEGVAEVLTTNFDLTDVADISCPVGVTVTAGTEFECTFTSGGEDRSVPVTVLNDEGQYRVGGPVPG